MPRHYRKLRGNSAYYPFAARTGMRARQRREVKVLRIAGTVLLGAAAVLLLRQTVGRGGQQHVNQYVVKVGEKAQPARFAFLFRQRIRPTGIQALGGVCGT